MLHLFCSGHVSWGSAQSQWPEKNSNGHALQAQQTRNPRVAKHFFIEQLWWMGNHLGEQYLVLLKECSSDLLKSGELCSYIFKKQWSKANEVEAQVWRLSICSIDWARLQRNEKKTQTSWRKFGDTGVWPFSTSSKDFCPQIWMN